jgi:Ca-activated chloride channel family protein
MNFANPGALWLLAPLIGVVILLYLLKMKRRDLRVPATFLWPKRTEEIRANSLFQKLRFSWLMVLQILALTFVIVALARPQTVQHGLAGRVTVLVVDASASMGSTDVKPSRFDEAKNLASSAVSSAQTGDRIAIVEAGPIPRVLCALSNDSDRLRRAVSDLQLYDSETDVGDAMRLAASLVGTENSARIVLLSDGVFDPIVNFAPGKASVVYQTIGKSDRNLAVDALGTTDTPGGRQLFCGVRNFAADAMKGTISIYADGKLLDSDDVSVAGRTHWGKTVAAPADAKVLEAKLTSPDDVLQADNTLVALTSPGASLRVLLVTKGDLFLERALALDPRVTLDRTDTAPVDGAPAYDIVVFDGIREVPVKSRGVLTFGSAGDPSPVSVIGSSQSPRFKLASKDPLLNAVDLTSVYVGKAEQVKAKSTADVLAQTTEGPLVVESKGDQRQVYVAFEPMQSDFPLQVGFPIFIANALDFLGGEGDSSRLAIRAGSPFSIASTTLATLTAPDNSTFKIEPTGSSLIVRQARKVGQYKLSIGSQNKTVYASLRSDLESNVLPKDTLALGGASVKATASPARFADFWRPAILLALLTLVGEWWLFAKRS